ncbi:MAG: hypothetical protein IJJ88_03885 [Oscillospiraceae bacterium]|nr:hypothetical protein [Oscillospiraceae bacterium]
MRFGTSSFKTLLLSNWKRSWPLGFGYCFVMFFSVAIPTWSVGRWSDRALLDMSDQLYNTITVMPVVAMIAALAAAMVMFDYLMKPSAVGMMHALPMRRSGVFAAQMVSGFSLLTAGNLFIALCTALLASTNGGVPLKALWLWLLCIELEEFFFFALAACCAAVTGWLLGLPVIYVGVNFMVLAYRLLLNVMAGAFYKGFSGMDQDQITKFTYWCTPVVKLVQSTEAETTADGYMNFVRVLPRSGLNTVWIYAAAGVVLLALAWLLYRLRHSETAGSAIVFPWLRPIVCYVISVAGGLAIGTLVFTLITRDGTDRIGLVLWQIVMGAVTYCAVQMLLQKSYKIWHRKTWIGLAILAAILILIPAVIRLDPTGYQRRLPEAEDVHDVWISGGIIDGLDSEDPQTIADTIALHALLIDGAYDDDRYDSRDTQYFHVTYTLKDGETFSRSYSYSIEDNALKTALGKLVNNPELRLRSIMDGREDWGTDFTGGMVYCWMSSADEILLTAEQARALYDAALADAATPVDVDALLEKYSGYDPVAYLDIELTTPKGAYTFQNVAPTSTHILALLEEYGITQAMPEAFEEWNAMGVPYGDDVVNSAPAIEDLVPSSSSLG